MQIFKFLAALLAIATLGIIGCGEEKAADSGTEGQYANPSEMMGEAGEMADPEAAPAEEAAEEAPAEEAAAEEAPAEEAPAEEAAEEAPAEEAPAEEAAEGEG